jgi:O-antigen/teichoic acid export membrane protein
LQSVVIVLLARGLLPANFAFVSTVNIALMIIVAINGFGLNRQIQYRRSRDRDDPQLPSLFARRLRYSYASAGLWIVAVLAVALIRQDQHWLALIPAAAWLLVEQITQVWNAVAIVDGQTQRLMSSYVCRRLPVVITLAAALMYDWDVVWAWTIGLALGAALAYAQARNSQEVWARLIWPKKRHLTHATSLDLGYWWSMVGDQVRDLDVALIALVNPVTAGIYALATRFMRPMSLVTQATASVAFPHLSRRDTVTRRELSWGVLLGSLPTFVMSLVLVILAPLLPRLVGSAYADSVPVFQVICITTALWGPSLLLVTYLQSRSDAATRAAGGIVLGGNILQVVGAFVVAWQSDALGGAIAKTILQGLALLILARLAFRESVSGRRLAADSSPGRVGLQSREERNLD